MSLLDLWVWPDRALVVVDTCAACGRVNSPGHFAKMLALPHAGVVLAGRGSFSFLQMVFFDLSTQPCSGFDEVSDSLEKIVAHVLQAGLESAGRAGIDPANLRSQEILAVGWSARSSRVSSRIVLTDPAETFVNQEWVVPLGDNDPYPEPPASIDDAVRIARWQVEKFRHLGAIGGRLVMAELSRAGVSTVTFDLS